MKSIRYTLLALLACNALTSCYRMPTDDDYSLVPSTNNPDTTRQRQDSLMPSVSY